MIEICTLSGCLSAHGGLLLVAIGAYYKYGDRSECYSKSFEGTTILMRSLKSSMTEVLSRDLQSFFDQVDTVPSIILGADGRNLEGISYHEKTSKAGQSEAFAEVVRKFFDGQAVSLGDYRIVLIARARWHFWMKWLSWVLLFLLCWQLMGLVLLAACMACQWNVSQSVLFASFMPSAVFACLAIFSLPFTLHSHNQIMQKRMQYDGL